MQKEQLKILIVGAGNYPIFETAIYKAFLELGYTQTELFTWKEYLESRPFGKLSELSAKAQNKFQIGPRISKINQALVQKCVSFQPDLVFIYTGILIFAKTIAKIKCKTNALVFSYNNDDPFASFYPKYHWRHYKGAITQCDYNFVFRHKNVNDIREQYQCEADILRAYYIDEKNFPCLPEERLQHTPEVIFMGHYEPDERSEFIQALMDKGVQVGVPAEHYSGFAKENEKLTALENNRKDYNRYLCSCKIPLIFLSKINHDTYTTRCFEIPAAGAFILSPFNEDMASMFEEDKEAVYYRNKEEFVEKVCYYLTHDEERETIAEAGRERLLKDGHEAKDRARQIVATYMKMRNE